MRGVKVVTDLSPKQLRRKARVQTDARVRIRLLAIANVLDGMSRGEAAQSVGLSRNALHHWTNRYNHEGLEGLSDHPRCGRPTNLDPQKTESFKQRVVAGAELSRDGIVSFRGWELQEILSQEFDAEYALSSVYKVLSRLNLRPLQPRPRHPDTDDWAQEGFKKTSQLKSEVSSNYIQKRSR
jgi:putative transposase